MKKFILLLFAFWLVQVSAQSGSWSTGTSMPQVQSSHSSVFVNGILYVIGGSHSAALLAYNPVTNSWSYKASMPSTRWNSAVGVINGLIYVAGGWGGGSCCPNNNLWVYDPANDSWSTLASMPTLSAGGAAGVINGKLYVSSLYNGSSGFYTLFHRYDPSTNTWATLPNSPNFHYIPAAGVINGKFYLAGGSDPYGNNVNATALDVYDPSSNSWSTLASMLVSRGGLAGGVINNKLYAAGGVNPNGEMNILEVYDPASDSWSTLPAMPTARHAIAGAASSDALYITGGHNGTSEINTLEIFSVSPVSASISGSSGFCQGQSITLTASTANAYLWNTGDTTQSIIVNNAGIYSVTVNTASGSASASKTITAFPSVQSCSISVTPSNNIYTGGVATNIYLGYGPQDATLTASATGGSGFTYQWTGNDISSGSGSSITFSPSAAGNYTVTCLITNSNGCSRSCSVNFCVKDIRSGTNKIYLCHAPPGNSNNTQSLSINTGNVASHMLSHSADKLGICGDACGSGKTLIASEIIEDKSGNGTIEILVSPNPFGNAFGLSYFSYDNSEVSIDIMDISGKVVSHTVTSGYENKLMVGSELSPGIYTVRVLQGSTVQVFRISKE
jgi:N-acetylneuraminic acid mutarotase